MEINPWTAGSLSLLSPRRAGSGTGGQLDWNAVRARKRLPFRCGRGEGAPVGSGVRSTAPSRVSRVAPPPMINAHERTPGPAWPAPGAFVTPWCLAAGRVPRRPNGPPCARCFLYISEKPCADSGFLGLRFVDGPRQSDAGTPPRTGPRA